MPHPNLSTIELCTFADEHLRYEIKMLLETTCFNPADRFEANMRVESFGVHLRNLIDFFYITPKPDDIVANHFFSEATIATAPIPSISENLKRAKDRANKELSYLTTKRIYGYAPEKEWDFPGLAMEITGLLRIFESNAQAGTLSDNFRQFIHSLM